MTTALLYDPIFLEHRTPAKHPEQPLRVEGSMQTLEALNWLQREGLVQLTPRAASVDELATVHERDYIADVERAAQKAAAAEARGANPIIHFATDTYVSAQTYNAAIKAAGAPLTAIDAIMNGEVDNAYCLVRPPGHHALPDEAMGFCLFNNVAVAARYAIDKYGLERVAIIDYDVHHGNGTQAMFYDDPRVLYISLHQAPFYPGTGPADELGEGEGLGTTVNIPLPADTGYEVYDPLFRQVVAPITDRFDPQLILVSAGFDAHWADPLGNMRISTAGFARLNEILINMARVLCNGRIVMVQEGGYNQEAMESCVATCLNLLLGDDAAVDSLGKAPDTTYIINHEVLIGELRRIHGLKGYRMRNTPKPDREKLLREIKGPDANI